VFYPDEIPVSPGYEFSPPPIVVVNDSHPEPQPPAEPLLIEWKSDKFVRSGGGADQRDVDYSASASGPHSSLITAKDLAPVTLVYRDGQHKQVSDYVISNGVMYARSDYLHTGIWTETVKLSALDLPETVRLNQQNGVNFVFPSGPNEVVTRP